MLEKWVESGMDDIGLEGIVVGIVGCFGILIVMGVLMNIK